MNRWFLVASLVAVSALTGRAGAEDVVLFQASKAGDKAWVWGGAHAKSKGAKLVVTVHNKGGEAGDAYIATRFPYLPGANVTLAVSEVAGGDYTLQVLGFRNTAHVETVPLIAHATKPGQKSFRLGDAGFTNNVDEILLKIWVGGAKDAAVTIDELTVSWPLAGATVLLDEGFRNMESWTNEDLVLHATGEGTTLSLRPGSTFGAILLQKRFPKQEGLKVLWDVGSVENGDATLQFVGFDKDGTYLKSFDGIKNARGGWYAVPIPRPDWPAAVDGFQIKLWLGGRAPVAARFGRLLIIKPAP